MPRLCKIADDFVEDSMKINYLRRPARLALRFSVAALALGAPIVLPGSPLVQVAQAQAAPVIGVVDGEKINSNFPRLKAALEAIEKRKQTLRSQLDGRVFLGEADTKPFDTLILKAGRSEAEEGQLNALAKKGAERRDEFNTLFAKANKSAGDSARIKAIEDESTKTAPALQRVIEQVDAAVIKQEQETEDRFRAQIVQAVEAIANEKKLLVVVGKQAVAWSSATVEITDEVVARLNKA